MTDLPLSGKRIVVTGAARGIGRAIALACARDGAIVGVGHRDSAKGAAVARAIEELGGKAHTLSFDVTDEAAVASAVDRFAGACGGIDGWVSNAGISRPSLLATADVADIRAQIDANLLGPILCARAVIPVMMRKRSGVIVHLGSAVAAHPTRGQAVYAATKGALEALTRALAMEYARKGVRCVCVAPGPVDTEMLASTRAVAGEEILARTPLGRIARPEEVADLVTYLLSDRAAFATGSVFALDGGFVGS
jgi:3-oxoacyl-[acyl-carrier protein] reductase